MRAAKAVAVVIQVSSETWEATEGALAEIGEVMEEVTAAVTAVAEKVGTQSPHFRSQVKPRCRFLRRRRPLPPRR